MKLTRHMAIALVAMLGVAAPAMAQTQTGDYVTSPKILADTKKDGKITVKSLGKTLTPAVPSGTTLYGPCEGRPAVTYRIRAACEPAVTPPVEPPVEPPVTPPAPPTPTPDPVPSDVIAKVFPNGEAAAKRGDFNVSWGTEGSLGTTTNVPAPFVTDAKNGFKRLAMYTGKGDDVFLQGRSQDVASFIVNGRAYHAGLLNGYRQIRGSFTDALTWTGETVDTTKGSANPPRDGIKITQQVAIDGTALTYRVRVTNARSAPVSITYYRSEDPDSAANFATQNRVPAQGTWDAAMTTGETYFIESPDAGVFNATQPYDKIATVGTRREAGYNAKADLTLQLVWPAQVLQPGQSADYTFRQGVR